MGELMVNIPLIMIIFIMILLLGEIGFTWNIAFIVSAVLGWFVWNKLLKIWMGWAYKNNIEPERLFKLGKIGLINFYRYKIFNFYKK